MHRQVRPRLARADLDMAVGNQFLDLRARVVGENGDEKAIEPLPLGVRCDRKFLRVLRRFVTFVRYAATLRRLRILCGVSGVVRDR
jgi:hypothetical protein